MADERGITYGRRIRELAAEQPDRPAIIFAPAAGAERILSLRDLDRGSDRVARVLAARGVAKGSMIVVALGNRPEHYLATLAGWKLGACVLPISKSLPPRERDALVTLAAPHAIVAEQASADPRVVDVAQIVDLQGSADDDAPPPPDIVSQPGRAIATGGSTGRSKIIVVPGPWIQVPGRFVETNQEKSGFTARQTQLVNGPLYHNMPFGWGWSGLFDEHTLVLLETFDAALAVDLVERHHVTFLATVPTVMQRIARLPDIATRDLSSIEALFHAGASCPAWVKRAWIDLIGPTKVFEAYGSSESIGATFIRGDEWLLHPGSVGLPRACDMRILDSDQRQVPAGVIGEIYMRPLDRSGPTYEYRGAAPARSTPDGFATVGDLGRVDGDGYLFVADRRIDMIVSGGANIYPAEIEAALSEHPDVDDTVVIGIPDPEWGRRVHAVVQPRDAAAPPAMSALDAHCRERLASYKVPKSYEFTTALPRDASGKIRRSAIAAERETGSAAAVIAAQGQPDDEGVS